MFLVGNQREYLILNLIHYILLYIHYIHRIKLPEYRIGIKFDKDSLAVEKKQLLEQNCKCLLAYGLDTWQRNPTNKFKFNLEQLILLKKAKKKIKKSIYIVDTE